MMPRVTTPNDVATVLVCVECGREAEGSARDWRAFLTIDDEVATYCPECAEREFPGQ